MKKSVLVTLSLAPFLLIGCGKGKSQKQDNAPDLNKIATTIIHDSKSCPANLTGTYCNIGEDQSRQCLTPILNEVNGVLTFSKDTQLDTDKFTVDGKVQTAVEEGQTYQTLSYCSENTLVLLITIPNVGQIKTTYSLDNDGKTLIYSKTSDYRGEQEGKFETFTKESSNPEDQDANLD